MKTVIMKNIISVISFMLVLFMNSCPSLKSQSNLIEINIEKNVKNIKKVNICDLNGNIRYIPLKADAGLLSDIILSDFSKDFVIVSDRRTCILYDIQGNTISKIGNQGKGPGEYIVVFEMKFGLHNQIIIQDGKSFLVYDLNGKFLRKFDSKGHTNDSFAAKMIGSWSPINDSLFIGQVPNHSGKEKYKAVFFNGMGTEIGYAKNYIISNINKVAYSSENCDASIYQFSGQTYFKELLNDTLFLVTNYLTFEPYYYFNLGKFGMPISYRELSMNEMMTKRNECIGLMTINETSKYLFLLCNFRNHSPTKRSEPKLVPTAYGVNGVSLYYTDNMLGIYEKATKELVFAKTEKIEGRLINCGLFNDYDGGPNFLPKKSVNDSTLAMWVDAYALKAHVASIAFKNSTPKYPEKKRELEKRANSLSENDNPVLILCTFKK